jgi:hypothetical protein
LSSLTGFGYDSLEDSLFQHDRSAQYFQEAGIADAQRLCLIPAGS